MNECQIKTNLLIAGGVAPLRGVKIPSLLVGEE